jgi:diguanylate cyclase (GGDEF)-like protein
MSRSRRAPWLLVGALGFLWALLAVRNATGAGPWPAWTTYLYNAIEVGAVAACAWRALAVAQERAAWIALTLGVASYTAGDLYWVAAWEHAPAADIPYPSIADALYLGIFPAGFVALGLLVRARAGRLSGMQWLDGVIAGAVVASLATALAPVLSTSVQPGDALTVATNLAYPIGDLLLLSFVVALAGACGRSAARTWWLLALGLAVFAAFDTVYLLQVDDGTYVSDGLLDVGWPLALVLFAAAAWQPAEVTAAHRQVEGLRVLAVPALAGLTMLTLFVLDHFERLPTISIGLAAAGLLGLLVRLAVIVEANRRLLVTSEEDARTDALTGLANRRALMEVLDRIAAAGAPWELALFDLDGFKEFNDRLGHPAGDALLARLGARLEAVVPRPGRAFRIGGDEFCVLVPAERAELVIAAAGAALGDAERGVVIGASCGRVAIPREAADPAQALRIVDQRMYANKRNGRASAVAQARDVLLTAVAERSPQLAGHGGDVAALAAALATRVGLSPEEVEHVRAAAELHDIGKLAVPDAILEKPGALDDAERAFMRRHTIVGERILLAAPALAAVAPLVRASHERWDGTGYPDGLAGRDIPIGARIVAVCDAWDAMVTHRSYRAALPHDVAVAELARCAGAQFDADVVAVFLQLPQVVLPAPEQTAA